MNLSRFFWKLVGILRIFSKTFDLFLLKFCRTFVEMVPELGWNLAGVWFEFGISLELCWNLAAMLQELGWNFSRIFAGVNLEFGWKLAGLNLPGMW